MKNENYPEIDLKDLLKELFKRWKSIVVIMLVCAILGGLYSLYLSNKVKPETSAEVAALTKTMTNEEKTSVEDAAKIIESYRSMYNKQKDYNDKSILQNLDAFNIATLTLSYYVDNDYQISYPIILETNNLVPIIETYAASLLDDKLYEEMAESVDETIDSSYYKEVVSADTEDKESGIFKITIYADTEERLAQIGDFIKTAIIEKSNDVSEICGSHNLILTSEVTSKTIDSEIAMTQQDNVKALTTIKKAINDEENAFSGNQLSYLKFLVHEELELKVNVAKYIVIGLFAGAILTIVYWCVRYFTSGTIKTEGEIVSLLSVNTFGDNNDVPDFIASKIMHNVDKSKYNKLAFIADVNDKFIKDVVDSCSVESVIVSNPTTDKDEFEKLVDCEAVVLVETLKTSKRQDLLNIKTMCLDAGVEIIGFIVE